MFEQPGKIAKLRCTKCGVMQNASCECGVAYQYIPARAAAERAVAAHPGKSNRAIAADVGISRKTVDRVRPSGGPNVPPEKRVGRDGKKQSATKKQGKQSRQADKADAVIQANRTLTREEIANRAGVSLGTASAALERDRGRREAEPIIKPEDLSWSAQQKLDAAICQQMKKLEATIEQRIIDGIKRRLDEMSLPAYAEEWRQTRELLERRKGYMSRADYRKILACLHPDSRKNTSEARLRDAFELMQHLELALVNEAEFPTEELFPSVEDLLKRKHQVKQKRKANRYNEVQVR